MSQNWPRCVCRIHLATPAHAHVLIQELSAAGEILIARNRDGTARILYYNDKSLNTHMDEGKYEKTKSVDRKSLIQYVV
jgi:hypothetical protein